MVTALQMKAGRALLDWSQTELAGRSGVARRTIAAFELGVGEILPVNLWKLVTVMQDSGVRFIHFGPEEGAVISKVVSVT